MAAPYEPRVNCILADVIKELFSGLDVDTIPEEAKGRKRLDIIVDYGGFRIVIEASYSRNDALKDAKKRIKNGISMASAVIALHYDRKYFEGLSATDEIRRAIMSAEFEAKILTQSGTESDWIKVRVTDFKRLFDEARKLAIAWEDIKNAVESIDNAVSSFVSVLSKLEKEDRSKEALDVFSNRIWQAMYTGKEKSIPNDFLFAQAAVTILMATQRQL